MVAFLRDEPGADIVAQAPDSQSYAHTLNLCEVFYDFYRAAGREDALRAVADLARVGVKENSNLSAETWQAAGTIKATLRRISLADCFALELAGRFQSLILTANHHEFDAPAGQAMYKIRFIR